MSAQTHRNEARQGALGEWSQRDHERLNSLWAEFLSLRTEDADAARHAFTAFRQGLERHVTWKDDLSFEELGRQVDERGKLFTALLTWEHQGLRRWLGRLVPSPSDIGLESNLRCTAFAGMLAGHNRRRINRDLPPGGSAVRSSDRRPGDRRDGSTLTLVRRKPLTVESK